MPEHTDRVLNRLRSASPQLYTAIVVKAKAVWERRQERETLKIEQQMMEAIAEGVAYNVVPLMHSILTLLQSDGIAIPDAEHPPELRQTLAKMDAEHEERREKVIAMFFETAKESKDP